MKIKKIITVCLSFLVSSYVVANNNLDDVLVYNGLNNTITGRVAIKLKNEVKVNLYKDIKIKNLSFYDDNFSNEDYAIVPLEYFHYIDKGELINYKNLNEYKDLVLNKHVSKLDYRVLMVINGGSKYLFSTENIMSPKDLKSAKVYIKDGSLYEGRWENVERIGVDSDLKGVNFIELTVDDYVANYYLRKNNLKKLYDVNLENQYYVFLIKNDEFLKNISFYESVQKEVMKFNLEEVENIISYKSLYLNQRNVDEYVIKENKFSKIKEEKTEKVEDYLNEN